MTDYTFTIGGVDYDVDAPDFETAKKAAHEYRANELSTQAKKEFADTPTWAKPFMAAQDVGRTLADTFTLGGVDKFADYMSPPAPGQPSNPEITQAIRSRMGGADIGADVAASIAQPSAVPRVVAKIGGAPLVRKVVGAGMAGNAAAPGRDGWRFPVVPLQQRP